jgi:hypothetical protein
MIKVIAEAADDHLIVDMSKTDFCSLQRAVGIDYQERGKQNKIGQTVDSRKVEDLLDAFNNLSSLKSGLKEMLTKWQTVLAKIEMTEETAKKK